MAQPPAQPPALSPATANAIDFSNIDADPARGLTSLFPWTFTYVQSKRQEWVSKMPSGALDADMDQFLFSWPSMGSTATEDQEWQCQGPLGRGGFGMVAHWRRMNAAGVGIDDVAIKQNPTIAFKKAPKLIFWHAANRPIPEEAINNLEMQVLSKKVVKLRNLKAYQTHRNAQDVWRLYFEYCRYGDLEILTRRYLRWCTRANVYLPEEFLWHVFYQLARAAGAMAHGPFHGNDSGLVIPDVYYLHSDIKAENIFLTRPDPAATFPTYPSVKVGDWGLAFPTATFDKQNPHGHYGRGTRTYMAPEQMPGYDAATRDRIRAGLIQPPSNLFPRVLNNPVNGQRLRTREQMNVWGFGAVMHQLMTLDRYNRQINLAYQAARGAEAACEANGWNFIPEITTNRQPEYSQELRDLVRQCLNVSPLRRPDSEVLITRTQNAVQNCRARLDAAGRVEPKVYLRGASLDPPPDLVPPQPQTQPQPQP